MVCRGHDGLQQACRINEMARPRQPEIIPPRVHDPEAGGLTDENLDHLARVLDDYFGIPGTRIRFGLDPIIGLIPGIGDTLTSIVSFLIVVAGWRRGLPMVTLARMVANIALDDLLGAVPVLGDMFDVFWKSNRMNLALLRRSQYASRTHTWRDWLFFGVMAVIAAALVVIPLLLLALLLAALGKTIRF